MNKITIVVIAFSIIIALVGLFIFTTQTPRNENQPTGSLVVWGTIPKDELADTFTAYRTDFKIEIIYREEPSDTFTNALIRAIAQCANKNPAECVTPDLVIQDSDWLTANKNILAPVPRDIASARDFQTTFVDAASNALIDIDNQKIWGIPIWLDPLVLFWNKQLFNENAIPLPPKNWDEFMSISNALRRVQDSGKVNQAGAALGRAQNIPLFKEISSLLLLQLGGNIEDETGAFLFDGQTQQQNGASAIRFYTDFAKTKSKVYTWNYVLPNPRDVFLEGRLGMMIDYLSYLPVPKQKNPHISYDIAPTPQLATAQSPLYFANVEAVSVLQNSRSQKTAWSFARWLGGQSASRGIIKDRVVAPARRDLLNDRELAQNQLFPLMVTTALNARHSRDSHSERNTQLIREIIETVADDRFDPAVALEQARRKAQEQKSSQ